MNVFDQLFPRQTRRQRNARRNDRRAANSTGRNRLLGVPEFLENRALLAVVTPNTPSTFFVDFTGPRAFDSEYAAYAIKNETLNAGNPIDAWIRATNFAAGNKVGLAPLEDGLYHIGPLADGQTQMAYFFLTANVASESTQTFDIQVFDGKPAPGDTDWLATQQVSFDNVRETNFVGENKITNVTLSPTPSVGGTLTMTVEGFIGNNAKQAFFTPATKKSWLPDIFELRGTQAFISGQEVTVPPKQNWLYFDSLPTPIAEQAFTITYTFLVTGSTETPTTTSPTQYVDYNNPNFWKHHTDNYQFPDIKPVYDVTIQKAATQQTVVAGEGGYEFVITVTNNSETTRVPGVTVVDTLPDGFTATEFSPATGVLPTAPTAEPFTWSIGTLLPKQEATLKIKYSVGAGVTDGKYTNSAILKIGEDVKGTATTDVTVTSPKLTIEKKATQPNVVAGEGGYKYVITVTNNGTAEAKDVTVVDTLPVGFTAKLFSPAAGVTPVAPTAGPFTWTIGTLGVGASTVLDVTYAVAANVAPGPGYINTAVVKIKERTVDTATTDVTVTTSSVLTVQKTAKEPTVIAGTGNYTYQITVTNNGPSDTQQAVSVVDTLPIGFTATAFDPEFGSVSPDAPTAGPFTWTIGLMTAGQTRVLDVTYKVAPDVTPGPKTNFAEVKLGTETKDTATTDVTVTTSSVLTIQKTAKEPTVTAGMGGYTFQITVKNNGPSDTQQVVSVVDTLPPGFTATAFAPEVGGVLPAAPTAGPFTWTIGFMTAGQTRVLDVTYKVAPDVTPGPKTNTADVKLGTETIDTATTDVTVTTSPVLKITKTANPLSVKPGQGGYKFQITVTNSGLSDAQLVSVVDTLPAGFTATAFSPAAGVSPVAPTAGQFTWTIGTLAAGASKILDVTYEVAASVTEGTKTNTADVKIGDEVKGTATCVVEVEGVQPPLSVTPGLVVGSDDGCNGPPWVRVLDPDSGEELSRFLAYDSRFRGSVRVATGDVTGDGVAEIITAPGRNAVGEVRVFQRNLLGAAQQNSVPEWSELTQYRTLAFGPGYRGGVEVAVADIDGDLDNDIVTAMSIRTGMVNVFRVTPGAGDPVANAPFKSFRGAPAGTNNGVMISAGDYIDNGLLPRRAEIAVGTNSGTRALVRVFDVSGTPTVVRSFKPFANNFRGGVTLSTADYDGNGSLDLIVGAGLNGGSKVEVWNPSTGTKIAQTSAFGSLAKPNARVFAVFGSSADGFIGTDSTLYGVQGLNGGRGSKGVWKLMSGKADPLINSQGSLPPLRIAPIGLPLAPTALRLR